MSQQQLCAFVYSIRAKKNFVEELKSIELYLLRGEYPTDYTKVDKANLRRKCRNNFKVEDGMLCYRRNVSNESEPWRICVRTEDEKRRVLESCHGGVEG